MIISVKLLCWDKWETRSGDAKVAFKLVDGTVGVMAKRWAFCARVTGSIPARYK